MGVHTLISLSNIVNYAILREENNLENCQIHKSNIYNYSPYIYNKTLEFFESEKEICEILTKFLTDIFNYKTETLELLYNYNDLEGLLFKGFFSNDNLYLKESLFSFIQTVFLNQKYYVNKDLDPRRRLGKLIMLDLLKKTQYIENSESRSSVFFNCYRNLLEKIDLNYYEENKIIEIDEIFEFIFDIISSKKLWSTQFIYEILYLLNIFLSKRKSQISIYIKNYGLIQHLAKNFIFSPEKNKSQSVFEQVIKVLLLLSQNSFENLEEFLGILNEKMKDGLWRSDKKNSWEFHPNFKEKSNTGYVGLKNLGCSKKNSINSYFIKKI